MDRAKIGSMTAKGGFINEQNICDKFNSWQKDNEAREWLFIMGYDSDKIKSFKVIHIPVKIYFFSENKVLIVNDILKGRGGLSAEWLLVTKKIKMQMIN